MKRTALNLLASILCFIVTACGSGTTSSTSSTPTMASFSQQIIAKSSVVKSAATAPTEAQKMAVIKMFQAMFNAAPGADLLNLCAGFLADGMTESTLANLLTGTALFQIDSLYPATLSNFDFSLKFMNNLVGSTVSETNKSALASQMAQLLDGGWKRGDLMWLLVSALSNVPSSDPSWGKAAAQLNNKLDVSYYYSVTKAVASGDLAILQGVAASVTDDSTTLTAAKAAIDIEITPDFNDATFYEGVTGLSIENKANDGTFIGKDCILVWNKPAVTVSQTNTTTAGSTVTGIYEVTITGSDTSVKRQTTITAERFVYTHEMNYADSIDGDADRFFTVTVTAIDSFGRKSKPKSIACYNSAPAKINMMTVEPFIKSVHLSWSPVRDVDGVGYRVHACKAAELVNGTLIPTQSNLIMDSNKTFYVWQLPAGDYGGMHYFRIVAYDTFGLDELKYSDLISKYVPTLQIIPDELF